MCTYQCASAYFLAGMFIFPHMHAVPLSLLSVVASAAEFLEDIGSLFLTLVTFIPSMHP